MAPICRLEVWIDGRGQGHIAFHEMALFDPGPNGTTLSTAGCTRPLVGVASPFVKGD